MTPVPRPIVYRADVSDDAELRLIGDPAGKRAIELGIGEGMLALALAERGAKAMAIDPDEERVAAARQEADRSNVRVQFHHGELADLGFATSASIDIAISAGTLGRTDDVPRLLRQVHRVLKTDGALIVGLEHPVAGMLDGATVRRHYGSAPHRSLADVFMALHRANFRVDNVQELFPKDDTTAMSPVVLLLRARKMGA